MDGAATRPALDPISRPATLSRRALSAALFGAAAAGDRLVAVGERGIVLLSDDGAASWRQAPAPTSVTLTAVHFVNATHGHALGHYGVVLRTEDAGQHWQLVLDGQRAADLAMQAAEHAARHASNTPDGPRSANAVALARRLVTDGPDKPFFDSCFLDEGHGFIVGAYNLCFETFDGGRTWADCSGRIENAKSSHLYAIRSDGPAVYVAGEQGLLLRSDDAGRSFSRLATPYAGSWFTLAVLPGGTVIVAGLRGNAYRSADRGSSWQKIDGLPTSSIVACSVDAQQTVWFASQSGHVFASTDGGRHVVLAVPSGPPGPPPPPLTGLLPVGRRGVLVTTLGGPRLLSMSPRAVQS